METKTQTGVREQGADRRTYGAGIVVGAAFTAWISHTAPDGRIVIPFVLLGAVLAYTSAMAASVGTKDTSVFPFGFGLGAMFGPIFYVMARLFISAVELFVQVVQIL